MADTVDAEFTIGNRKASMVLRGNRDFLRFRDFLRSERTAGGLLTNIKVEGSESFLIFAAAHAIGRPEPGAVENLFAEIRSFPLVNLSLKHLASPGIAQPLAAAIRATRATLESLTLAYVKLDKHRYEIVNSLREHPNLQGFRLTQIAYDEKYQRVQHDLDQNIFYESKLDGLVTALASCPQLTRVRLDDTAIRERRRIDPLSKPVIQKFCENPRLQYLSLNGPGLNSTRCLPGILAALQPSKSLNCLKVQLLPTIAPTHKALLARAIGNFLTINTSVTTLNVDFGRHSIDDSDTSVTAIVQALEHNRSVTCLQLRFDGGGRQHSPGLEDALVEMLAKNYTLEDIQILFPVMVHCPAVKFYLDMNRQGWRRILMRDGDTIRPHYWVSILWHVKDCPSILFYFLSMKPSLCQCHRPVNQGPTTSRPSKRQRLN